MHVALYVRVSTTRQAENDLSIPDQLRHLNEWAKANGHLVLQHISSETCIILSPAHPMTRSLPCDRPNCILPTRTVS